MTGTALHRFGKFRLADSECCFRSGSEDPISLRRPAAQFGPRAQSALRLRKMGAASAKRCQASGRQEQGAECDTRYCWDTGP